MQIKRERRGKFLRRKTLWIDGSLSSRRKAAYFWATAAMPRAESALVGSKHILLADKLFAQAIDDAVLLDHMRQRDKRAENDHVRRAHVARLDGEVVGRYVVHGHVVTAGHNCPEMEPFTMMMPPDLTRGANL